MTDNLGRYVFVRGKILDETYTFANIYAPNTQQDRFLRDTLRALHDFTTGCLVLGGDFNIALHPTMDASRGHSSTPPLHCLKFVNFSTNYTFYSTPNECYTRIDYFFLPYYYLPRLWDSAIGGTMWSDHAPLTIQLTSPLHIPKTTTWRLHENLLSNPQVAQDVQQALTIYFTENLPQDTFPLLTWEAHKCVMRGILISHSSALKKARDHTIRELTAKIGTLTQAHKQTLDYTLLGELTAAREELAWTLRQSYTRALQRTKSFFYTEGDKCSRLLARMINKKRSMTYIARMRDTAGQLHHMPDQIATAVTRFYTDLYAIPPHAPRADPNMGLTRMNAYLTKYTKTKLSSDAAEALEAPLMEGELALQTLAANIVLLPKEGGDTERCTGYRPISLLNCDLRLFAKILATRLNPHIPDLISPDQPGTIRSGPSP
ncbi:Hypothetical predicted protein [Pelobates cultripes]|uniref:Endonuclease/exonuclease/phosphatase domain-containing protein n=1 Tax=Pelobates cultripes TaxID=61616 RepID=A0AAD1RU31_PELCU|nr:Hypothetical predicted protein [Pelobates cultripes]